MTTKIKFFLCLMLLASITAVAQEQSSTSKNADKAAELYQLGMKYTGSDGNTQPDLEKAAIYNGHLLRKRRNG